MRRWGISPEDTVVVYDDFKNLSSARAWWLLRHAGLSDVCVLDGALRGWAAAGLPLESGTVTPTQTETSLRYGGMPVLALDDVRPFLTRGTLLDARAAERYCGAVEPIDPQAGHIPGALSAPTTETLDAEGRFLAPEELRRAFLARGVREDVPVAAYCGSGVTASHLALALTLAGFSPTVFPGSWSQWSQHSELPVATGEEPGQAA